MSNQLDQLKNFTTVSADTADFSLMKELQPEDATTNPSLISIASQLPSYAHFMDEAIAFAKAHHEAYSNDLAGSNEDLILELAFSKLTVMFGVEILKIIPGRVSAEIDPKCSFDTEMMIQKGKLLIRLFEDASIPRNRVYVKIPATWEGIRAAEALEGLGINCNLTLIFSFAQAVACAQAGVSLISPFVGRILDWHTKNYPEKVGQFVGAEDPGVVSVRNIYDYYKQYGYSTIVMGASFRNEGEILELAGCDKLTISTNLLKKLTLSNEPVPRKLDPSCPHTKMEKMSELTKACFLYLHNEDAMAVEKLAEGIRNFAKDTEKVYDFMRKKLNGA
ncbi:unnamed protein product [Phytomonas sp. Hart1]|nr:unnamed protein product [Phytomonas sp. Hart1]|eukprot:CCW71687.1 unnamed protein product [Phytomonas sp. isolate Hart1]